MAILLPELAVTKYCPGSVLDRRKSDTCPRPPIVSVVIVVSIGSGKLKSVSRSPEVVVKVTGVPGLIGVPPEFNTVAVATVNSVPFAVNVLESRVNVTLPIASGIRVIRPSP